jgi:hypothetical protein
MLLSFCRATAQAVAVKDLTATVSVERTPVTPPKAPFPAEGTSAPDKSGDCAIGFRDGVIAAKTPEMLQLEITGVEPTVVHSGASLVVTVRLKNAGAMAVSVPWATPPVEPDTNSKTGTKSWQMANVYLTFATSESPRNGTILKGRAVLAATPSNITQHVELLPGQWVDIKFMATLECDSSLYPACGKYPLPIGRGAELTAHWWEWMSTYDNDGCNAWKGTYESRNLDSKPLAVVFDAKSPSTEEKSVERR